MYESEHLLLKCVLILVLGWKQSGSNGKAVMEMKTNK